MPRHPRSRYVWLRLGASVIRVLALAQRIHVRAQLKALPPSVERVRLTVPSRAVGRHIVVDRYAPRDVDTTVTRLPVHLNFHGSGFVIPSLGSDAAFCGRVAVDTQCVVFDCSYRVAPDDPFPSALEDVEDIARYILAHDNAYDVERFTVSGFSAGANLAVSLSTLLGPQTVRGCCGFYGNYDLSTVFEAPESGSLGGVNVPAPVRRFFYACLIPDGLDARTPFLSPAYADATAFPAHLLLACGRADPLHESGRALAERLQGMGHRDVVFLSHSQAAHGFDKRAKAGTPLEAEKERMYKGAIDAILRSR